MDEAEDTFDKVGDSTNIVINVTDNDWIYPEPEEVDEEEAENEDDGFHEAESPSGEGVQMQNAGSPDASGKKSA